LKSIFRALGAGAVLCFAVSAVAQSLPDVIGSNRSAGAATAALENPPTSGPVDPREYVVGPGDYLQAHMTGGVARNWDLVVSPEGNVFVPSVGTIHVAGLSLQAAKEAIVQRVSSEYRNVGIEVQLARARTMLVHLAGETRANGPLGIPATSRVTEILRDTVFTVKSSLRNIELRRQTPAGERTTIIDLQAMRLTGRTRNNPLLRDGDVLFVPVATASVALYGAVGRPDVYELGPDDSLSTLLAIAGGPLADAADEGRFVRFRDPTHSDTLAFRVADLLAGRYNPALRNGDRAFIFFRPKYYALERVTIMGEVQRPGTYPLTEGADRISQIVAEANGFLPDANVAALRLYRGARPVGEANPEIDRLNTLGRRDMTNSEYEILRASLAIRREDFRIDWNRLQKEPALDVQLRDGDVIRVDELYPTVRVEGEVKRPGLVRFEPGRHAEDYVRMAGGFGSRAARGQVRITSTVTGQTVRANDAGPPAAGDLVWVPEKRELGIWQSVQTSFLFVAQLIALAVVVRRP